jgi:uncharacterized protein (DUF4415 family)
MKDEDIDLSEIPEISENQMALAVLRVGGKPVPAGQVLVPLPLDRMVLEYFKKRGGADYRRLMNEVLEAAAARAD